MSEPDGTHDPAPRSPGDIDAGEFLASFRQHHGPLADAGLEWFTGLGPLQRKEVGLLGLSDALHYLEVARVVMDLEDPDQAFEAYAHLTEELGLPDAAELLESVR